MNDPALRRAVRRRCEREIRAVFGQPWSELRVRVDPRVDDRTLSLEKDARALSTELLSLLRRVDAWAARARPMRKRLSFLAAATALLRFEEDLRRDRRGAGRLPDLDPNGLSARQWLVRRLTRPRFGQRPLGDRELTARDMAIISLLLGNFPQPKERKLLTEDQVIEYERKAMHKAMDDVGKRRAPKVAYFYNRYNITGFSFLAKNNPALRADVVGMIDGSTISVALPQGTNKTALVATFETTGAEVTVGSVVQVSGKSPNDFSAPVTYVVFDGVDTTRRYNVTVV